MKSHAAAVAGLNLVCLLWWPTAASADAVLTWNENAAKAATAACLHVSGNGLAESRLYAMVHVAIHDAVNAIDRRSRPYAYGVHAISSASIDAAIAAAARDTLVSVFTTLPESAECRAAGIAAAEAFYAAALGAVADGAAKTDGVAVGQAAANAIILRRVDDGSDTLLFDFDFPQGTEPGEWRFTPDFPFQIAFAPKWGDVKPFALTHSSQFVAQPPLDLKSHKYAAEYQEIKLLGGDDVTTPSRRTPDQTQIGRFWLESSLLAWNRIARAVSADRGFDLWQNARLFGLLNIALADGYIASWEAKYHYRFWRPITAIRLGDTDGNPKTVGDPTWTPLQPTYPMPDHDSGHAMAGGVAAEVLRRVFGTDDIPFTACSTTVGDGLGCGDPFEVRRAYPSFSQANYENANSRIYVGIHFRRAVQVGVRHGAKIASYAVRRYFKPVR